MDSNEKTPKIEGANIPPPVRRRLTPTGLDVDVDVDTVLYERLGGKSDEDVWTAAPGQHGLVCTLFME